MGSDSDLPVMRKGSELLDTFGVAHRMTIASAHRSPEHVRNVVRRAESDGISVFIAAAGMAAHLAGAIAGMTALPVIGVPMGSKLSGLDSLLSTVQMPPGVPVATVAIDGAANAALLAVQILALSDSRLKQQLSGHKKDMRRTILRKAKILDRSLNDKQASSH